VLNELHLRAINGRCQVLAGQDDTSLTKGAAVMLMVLAASAELFHTPTGTAYADITVAAHRETWPVRSQRFRAWLRRRYYEATGDAPSPADFSDALNLLEARAQFDGPEREVHVRLAEHAGKIYLDLADSRWRSVEIGPAGWQVVEQPPVRFRRPPGMLALPDAERGGSIEALSSLLNLQGPDDPVLVTAWLLAALRHGKPYPLLVISGEQGSSKTMLAKMLRALIDPNVAPAGPCRVRNAISSSPPTMAMSWRLPICPSCRLGFPTRSAGWRAEAASRSASSTQIKMRCCSMLLAPSFSMASKMSSRAPISRIVRYS